MNENDANLIADEASATLRQGIGRSLRLAVEARHRLSELTSQTPYPGPAEFILADAKAQSDAGTSTEPTDPSGPETTA